MKTSTCFLLLLLGVSLFIRCKQSDDQGSTEGVNGEHFQRGPKYVYPVEQAQADVARYYSMMLKYDSMLAHAGYVLPPINELIFKGFTVRSVDLIEAMGMPLRDTVNAYFKNVRVYVGLNTDNQYKLFLTPVDGANLDAHPQVAGKDHILRRKVKNNSGIEEEQGYVMDFASPCPNTCPDEILIY